jgi:hypothetical protein
MTLNVGMGVGLIIAGAAMASGSTGSYRALYVVRALTLVMLAVVVMRTVRLPERVPATPPRPEDMPPAAASPRLIVGLTGAVFLLFTVGYSQLDSGFVASVAGTRSVPSWTVAAALVVNTVVVVVTNFGAGDRFSSVNPTRLLAAVPLLWAFAWALTAVALSTSNRGSR